jgi:hypothetical protein
VSRDWPEITSWYNNDDTNQVLIIISPQLLADDSEMYNLVDFANRGNTIFISTRKLSVSAMDVLHNKSSVSFDAIDLYDSLKLSLEKPSFNKKIFATYPGFRYDTYFYQVDSAITQVLSVDEQGDPNFIRLQTGRGNIYLHLAPLAFSNYFILHKDNYHYYEQALSVVSNDVEHIIWDEYYLNKKWFNHGEEDKDGEGWLGELFKYPGLKAGLLTIGAACVLFMIVEGRRRQSIIPRIEPVKNESLDFIKTIGWLYYEQVDHKNLAKKMAQYFTDHIRNRYQLRTNSLDENFIQLLHQKADYPEASVRQLVAFINFLDEAPAISENQLVSFHKQLENFYKQTLNGRTTI